MPRAFPMVCEASAGRLAACFAAALALCLSAACSFLPSEPYREVRTFDLGVPEAIGSASALQVQPFGADSACKFKMLYRAEGNEMLIDEYNRWAQPPGQMLTKYLRIAFRDLPGEASSRYEAPKYELSGSILAFEADLSAKRVDFGVHYILSLRGAAEPLLERTAIFVEPLENDSPTAVASSMSRAVAKFAASLKGELAGLEEKPLGGKALSQGSK